MPTRRLPRAATVLALVLSLLLTGPLAVPGTAPAEAAGSTRRNSAWLPYWSMDAAVRSVVANKDLFHTASPFWYQASCRSVAGHRGAGSPTVTGRLRGAGLRVVPTVTSTMTPSQALSCFGSRTSRTAHVDRLVRLARDGGYDGIDVNYEHLALTTSAGAARKVGAAFATFVEQLCPALRRAGKTCTVTVMPRTGDAATVWRGKLVPAVYDYRRIGRTADRVRVMAYDQHASGTGPGPVGGYPWTAAVADYARGTIAAGKVELGAPMYGRDWVGSRASTLTGRSARDLAARHGARIAVDPVQKASTFTYRTGGRTHTVWFTDGRALAQRHALARSNGFGGNAFWAAGQEDPAVWTRLRTEARKGS